jgi:hypothetical protein
MNAAHPGRCAHTDVFVLSGTTYCDACGENLSDRAKKNDSEPDDSSCESYSYTNITRKHVAC